MEAIQEKMLDEQFTPLHHNWIVCFKHLKRLMQGVWQPMTEFSPDIAMNTRSDQCHSEESHDDTETLSLFSTNNSRFAVVTR